MVFGECRGLHVEQLMWATSDVHCAAPGMPEATTAVVETLHAMESSHIYISGSVQNRSWRTGETKKSASDILQHAVT